MRKQRSAPPPIVRVTVIGKCEVALGRSRVRPDAAVFFALLCYLGMKAGERVTRDELLELLWTDEPDAARRHALRQMVYRLRRAGLKVEGAGTELVVDPARVSCDLRRLCADDWAATADLDDIPSPADVLPSYHHAITPHYAEWVESLRSTAASQIRRAALRYTEVATREGRWDDVERAARLALAADPLNQAATLALAEATAMRGSKAEALRVLDAYLWEMHGEGDLAAPARLLRRRIADQPLHRVPRAADPPLVARAREVAWLNAQLDAVAAGARTALLVGPPGIGKTAVARTFMAHAEMRGWRLVTSRQQPSDVDGPTSVFQELIPVLLKAEGGLGASPESIAQLRRLIEHRSEDDILSGKSQEAEAVQARIRSSLHDLLCAVTHEGPIIVLIEDVHWIDRQSLRLLTWIVEHAAALPLFWLITSRLESRFPEVREAFPDDRTPVLSVEPLDRNATATLFRAVAGVPDGPDDSPVPDRAYAVTGGNPLFIREVASHWAETRSEEALPTNLRALMRGRVNRLSSAAQRVLHCCAILGRYATVPRVAAVLEISTSDLLSCVEEVETLGVLGLGGELGSLALHDLWQEELASGLRPGPRALLHLRCGDELYAEGKASKEASVIVEAARHLVSAGAKRKALAALEEAAAHHRANGMTAEAIAALDTAVGLCVDDRDKLRAHENRIEALRELGAWPDIRKVLGWALATQRAIQPTASVHSVLELADVEATLVADSCPAETLVRATRCASASDAEDRHRAAACRIGARVASNLFDTERLTYFSTVAEQIARRCPEAMQEVLSVAVVYHTDLGDLGSALDIAEKLVARERAAGSVVALSRALRYFTVPLRVVGAFDRATEIGADAFKAASRQRLVEEAAAAADIVAWTRYQLGDLPGAIHWLQAADPWLRRLPASYVRASASTLDAIIAAENGAAEAALRAIGVSREQAEAEPVLRQRLFLLSVHARVALLTGETDAALGLADRIRVLLLQAGAFRRTEYFVGTLTHVLRRLRSRAAAEEAFESCGRGVRGPRVAASRFVTEVLGRTGLA